MTTIDKTAIRDRMLALEEEELAAAREHYETYLAETHLAEGESHDSEDLSLARISADMAHAFEAPVHTHEAKIAAIRGLDFAPRTDVGPGAVVSFGGRSFVVAVSTRRFDVAGETYMGISVDSPIYRRIEGLTEGDMFEQNGASFRIDRVV